MRGRGRWSFFIFFFTLFRSKTCYYGLSRAYRESCGDSSLGDLVWLAELHFCFISVYFLNPRTNSCGDFVAGIIWDTREVTVG